MSTSTLSVVSGEGSERKARKIPSLRGKPNWKTLLENERKFASCQGDLPKPARAENSYGKTNTKLIVPLDMRKGLPVPEERERRKALAMMLVWMLGQSSYRLCSGICGNYLLIEKFLGILLDYYLGVG